MTAAASCMLPSPRVPGTSISRKATTRPAISSQNHGEATKYLQTSSPSAFDHRPVAIRDTAATSEMPRTAANTFGRAPRISARTRSGIAAWLP